MNTRRDFLKKMTAASVVLPMMSSTNYVNTPPYSGKKLRIALVGLGSYATRVANAMKTCEKAELVGIVSGTPSKLTKWQAEYGIAKENSYSYAEFDKIKNNANIDLVYLTLPNSMHHPFTLRGAKAGKHVLTEKPMSVSVKEAEEMIAACKKANVKLYVGYRLHFEPYTRELIRIRESGELGKIMSINTANGFKIGDPTQWRLKKSLAGGGAMMDVGVYCINGARYASGEDPIWVIGNESKTDLVKFKEVDETIAWQMGFPSGLIANCATTYNFNSSEFLQASGEKGFVELSPCYGYGPLGGRTNKGAMNQPLVTHQTYQMDGIADCILNNAPEPNINGQEGLKDMKIVEAIYRSIAQNGKKIMIKY